MYIARRIKDVQVSQIFDTQLLHFQIPGLPASILIEDSVCIIGCFGGPIAFFDIGCRGGTADVCPSTEIPFSTNTHHDLAIEKEQVGNLCCRCRPEHLLNIFPKDGEAFHSKSDTISSMHYRKPFLFVASFCVEQISPLPRQMDKDNRRHLWEYPSEALAIKQCQMPILPEDEEPPPANRCSIHPFGGDGDLLVAWPDTSIYRLGNFSPKLIWEPSSEMLVERVDIDMMQITGLNVVGNCFLVNFSDGVSFAKSIHLNLSEDSY